MLDLLSFAEIERALASSHGVMRKGGLLCVAGLTRGNGFLPAATSKLWALVQRLKPSLVGGCRPIVVRDLLLASEWRIVHDEVVVSATVPSEVVIAAAI